MVPGTCDMVVRTTKGPRDAQTSGGVINTPGGADG